MLGALSEDHMHLSMDGQDMARYQGRKRWKEQKARRERNLNA